MQKSTPSHQMRKTNYLLAFALLVFIYTHPAYSNAPIWIAKKNGQQLIIGGTIHLLTPADYPLPAAFKKAYEQSEKLVFESDIQKIQDPAFQLTMMSELIYTDGRDISSVLSKETYQMLKTYCASRGIPIATLINFKPGMIAITLTMMELQRLGIMGTGVDAFFSAKAIQDNKQLGQFETAEQQLSFISSMGEGKEDEIITHALRDIAKLPTTWETLRTAWRQGNLKKLKEVALTPLKNDFPNTYETILNQRNNAWLPQIEALFKTKKATFILVGILHLVGEDGLLNQLSAKGYQVERF